MLHQVEAPDVDDVTGLPPTVAPAQRRSSRSTVGTVTAISNSLRLLMSREGDYPQGPARTGPGHCPAGTNRLYSDAFSPNTVEGACPRCHGQGVVHEATEASRVPDPSLSIRGGAIASWPGAWQGKNLRDVLAALGYDIDRPWRELSPAARNWILFTDEKPVVTVEPEREPDRIHRPYQGTYTSAERLLLRAHAESKSEATRARAAEYLHTATCPLCEGRRLKPESLAVFGVVYILDEPSAGLHPADTAALTTILGRLKDSGNSVFLVEHDLDVVRHADWLIDIGPGAGAHGGRVLYRGNRVCYMRCRRRPPPIRRSCASSRSTRCRVARALTTLADVGLGYLRLGQPATELSGGEAQRVKLATELQRARRTNTIYLLEEPTTGLHPADTDILLTQLNSLVDTGATVIVVEHDMTVVAQTDHVVDMGPGGGAQGGRIVAQRHRNRSRPTRPAGPHPICGTA